MSSIFLAAIGMASMSHLILKTRRVAQPFPKVLNWVPHPSRFWCMGRVGFFGPAFDFVSFICRRRSPSSTSSNNVRHKPNQTQKQKYGRKAPPSINLRMGHPPQKPNVKSQVKICTAPSTTTVLSSLKIAPTIQ